MVAPQYGSVARWKTRHCCFEGCETQCGTSGKQERTQTVFAGDFVTIRRWCISHTVPLTPEYSATSEATHFFRSGNTACVFKHFVVESRPSEPRRRNSSATGAEAAYQPSAGTAAAPTGRSSSNLSSCRVLQSAATSDLFKHG